MVSSKMQLATHEACLMVRPVAPGVEGPFYHRIPTVLPFYKLGRLKLAVSIKDKGRDGLWYHVSYSLKGGKQIPTHRHTISVRRAMFRPTSVVVAVFPPEEEYVNEHKTCLHLWERLEGPRVIPDLREMGVHGSLSI